MLKRSATAVGLLLLGFPALVLGGLPYFLFIGFLLCAAAWEYSEMFRAAGARPARWLVLLGVAALLVARFYYSETSNLVFSAGILVMLTWHLVDYERGTERAGLDFGISVGALAYLGWIGAYLLDMRHLDHGAWWLMFVLPCVWFADVGAYMIGAAYGKHRMTPRLSPRKTWEGFAAGALSAMLTGMFFAFAYSQWGPLHLSIWAGGAFGLVVGLLTPLGDLGESMLKRQAGMKDSGNIFPGHGGAFDRIDSWLWAGVLGFYFIVWFVR